MPTRIKRYRQRALISKLVVGILNLLSERYYKPHEDAGDVLIGLAVLQGQAEGRPMTSGMVAKYIGMPRATAYRRVAALVKQGRLNMDQETKTLSIPTKILNSSEALQTSREISRRIHQTNLALSKVDTDTIV